MEEIAEKLADQWRVHNNRPLLESPHECSMETCNLQHIVGGIWRHEDKEHVCVRILCKNHPPWANRGQLKKQIRNIYMCCATGHHHCRRTGHYYETCTHAVEKPHCTMPFHC